MKLRHPDDIRAPKGVAVRCEPAEGALNVYIKSEAVPVDYVRLIWDFTSYEVRKEPVKVLGDCWERGYGELEWGSIMPHRVMPWAFMVSNGSDTSREISTRYTEGFGVMARPGAVCMWCYEKHRATLIIDARSGGEGVHLNGRELLACRIRMGEYWCMSAFEASRRFYKTLCTDGIFPSESVYGSNNWYYAYGKSNRAQILKDAGLIAELCEGLSPRPFIVIDAGWNLGACCPWEANNPDYGDMQTLAQEIAALDVKPGAWVRYLCNEEGRMEVPAEWRLSRDGRYLDPSHPEVLDYIKEVTRRISAEWGYKLIKHDFSFFDVFGEWGFQRKDSITREGWTFFDNTKTSAEIMENMYRTIYESAAPGTVIIACNVPGFLTAGYAHINRAGDDTSGKDWERTRRYGVNTVAFRKMYDGAFYKADCDCVGHMGLINWGFNRKWARLIASSGTPLFFSIDPDVVNAGEKAEIKNWLKQGAAQTDTAIPMDWMETTCPERWKINGEETEIDWGSSM